MIQTMARKQKRSGMTVMIASPSVWIMGGVSPAEHPVERAARLRGFEVPKGWVARPKPWQRHRGGRGVSTSRNPYAARASADVPAHLHATKPADPPVGAG